MVSIIDFIFYYGGKLASFIGPLVGTVILAYLAAQMWYHYVTRLFISGIEWVLLEIKVPRDVVRSPKAMELVLTNSLYQMSIKGMEEMYWTGAVHFWFSLEIVSIEGKIHFYIRVPSRIKQLVETQIYAQYSQAEVMEVEDYALKVGQIKLNGDWNAWGCEFKLLKPNVYPIKTYEDFGLGKDPKEEYKIDPITPVIELLGSLGKGEQYWIQIICRAAKEAFHTNETWWKKHIIKEKNWIDEARKEMMSALEPFTNKKLRPDGTYAMEVRSPDFMRPMVEGMTKKITKLGFDCGIRCIYVAKTEVFSNNGRRNLRLAFRQYASPLTNSFERYNSTQFDYFWQYTKKSLFALKNRMVLHYRERELFYPPLRHKIKIPWPFSILFPKYAHTHHFILNSEELATIFHFPGQVSETPTFKRIESKTAKPPANLPI